MVSQDHLQIGQAYGLAMKIKDRTLPIVYTLEKSTFADNCKKVCRSVKSVEEDEIQSQFYVFLKRLEIVTKADTNEILDKKDPKELIKLFSSSPQLYEGIELLMRATYEACIKISVESVGDSESIISIYNQHQSKIRNISEDNANDELLISFNGPEVGEADNILKQALDLHFAKYGKGWHFTTNSPFKTSGATFIKVLREAIKSKKR